jgi:uncharacterized RDD family membrane protein YckC
MHELKYAGRPQRFVAILIDALILGLVGLAINLTLATYGGEYRVLISYFTQILLSLGYFVVLQTYLGGQTLGKKIMGIRVVNWEGKKPTLGRMAIREIFGKFCSYITYGVGFLMILWDRKRQGLHDKVADTYVVKA